MKTTYVFILILLLACTLKLQAWNGHTPAGARVWGMGGISITLSDPWAAYNNQAGLGHLKKFGAGIAVENRFGMKELSGTTIVTAFPTKQGTFGLTYHGFGQSSFLEQKIGLAYGRAFTKHFAFGFQINYLNTSIPAYGNNHKVCIEGGIQVQLLKELSFGAHVFNPTLTKMAEYNNERIPLLARMGLTYEPSQKLMICAELEKNSSYPLSVRTGLEYRINDKVALRAGLSTRPFLSTFGFRIQIKKLSIDIASGYHQLLVFTPHLSLNYQRK
jgi:hypothetical protein